MMSIQKGAQAINPSSTRYAKNPGEEQPGGASADTSKHKGSGYGLRSAVKEHWSWQKQLRSFFMKKSRRDNFLQT